MSCLSRAYLDGAVLGGVEEHVDPALVLLALLSRVLEVAEGFGGALGDVVVPVFVVGESHLQLGLVQERLDVEELGEEVVHPQQVDLEPVPVEQLPLFGGGQKVPLVERQLHEVELEVVLDARQLYLQVHFALVDVVLLEEVFLVEGELLQVDHEPPLLERVAQERRPVLRLLFYGHSEVGVRHRDVLHPRELLLELDQLVLADDDHVAEVADAARPRRAVRHLDVLQLLAALLQVLGQLPEEFVG